MFNAAGRRATGYGIACGAASRRAVLDVDGPEAVAEAKRRGITSGYVVKTGRTEGDGYHLYFELEPGVEVESRTLAPGLELKGEGCYVVGPGSRHPSGAVYRVVKDGTPSPAPAWMLEAERDAVRDRGTGERGPVAVDVAGPPIPDGGRNRELTRIAGRLHDGTRDLEALARDLEAVNSTRCQPPLPTAEVGKIAASIHRRKPCKTAPAVTPRVKAAIDYLASVERSVKGVGGATRWSVYRAGLAALAELGREHPEGVTLSLDVRTWADMAGTSKASVSRHIRRSPLMRVIQPGRGRRSATVLFTVPDTIGHKARHSSTGGLCQEGTTSRSVSPDALTRTLERLRWGPGRIGKSRAALLKAVVDCDRVVSRSEIAAKLGRKPASIRAPLRWLVEAGLLERVGRGLYATPSDLARRIEDARELGREPEADRLQIARHDREREAFGEAWQRGEVVSRERRARRRRDRDRLLPEERHPSGTVADLERVPDPDPDLVEALRHALVLWPDHANDYPSWWASTLYVEGFLPTKPMPNAVEVALAALREDAA